MRRKEIEVKVEWVGKILGIRVFAKVGIVGRENKGEVKIVGERKEVSRVWRDQGRDGSGDSKIGSGEKHTKRRWLRRRRQKMTTEKGGQRYGRGRWWNQV